MHLRGQSLNPYKMFFVSKASDLANVWAGSRARTRTTKMRMMICMQPCAASGVNLGAGEFLDFHEFG